MESYYPDYLDVSCYAHSNKKANLLYNQTKAVRNLLTDVGLINSLVNTFHFCMARQLECHAEYKKVPGIGSLGTSY